MLEFDAGAQIARTLKDYAAIKKEAQEIIKDAFKFGRLVDYNDIKCARLPIVTEVTRAGDTGSQIHWTTPCETQIGWLSVDNAVFFLDQRSREALFAAST